MRISNMNNPQEKKCKCGLERKDLDELIINDVPWQCTHSKNGVHNFSTTPQEEQSGGAGDYKPNQQGGTGGAGGYLSTTQEERTCKNGHVMKGIGFDVCPECEAEWIETPHTSNDKGEWSECNNCFDGDHDLCVSKSCECKHSDKGAYYTTDHFHCWTEKKPPCGQRIKHFECCLCKLPNPEIMKLLQETKSSTRREVLGEVRDMIESLKLEEAPPFSSKDTYREQAKLTNEFLMPAIKETLLASLTTLDNE